jgi:hypothetical protein
MIRIPVELPTGAIHERENFSNCAPQEAATCAANMKGKAIPVAGREGP